MIAKKGQQLSFTIEPLDSIHDRAAFSCANPQLENYLKHQASQDLKKHAAVPYVATPDHKIIAGFYTLSQYSIDLDNIPEDLAKRFPKYPLVPATLLGRLAVDKNFLGQGLGKVLLLDALHRALQTSTQAASAAVIVDAKDDAATAFYQKYGFIALPEIERRLFIPMHTIAQLFPSSPR